MTAEEEETLDKSMIRGIILVFDYLAYSLFDTRATHNFIASALVRTLGLSLDVLTIP